MPAVCNGLSLWLIPHECGWWHHEKQASSEEHDAVVTQEEELVVVAEEGRWQCWARGGFASVPTAHQRRTVFVLDPT